MVDFFGFIVLLDSFHLFFFDFSIILLFLVLLVVLGSSSLRLKNLKWLAFWTSSFIFFVFLYLFLFIISENNSMIHGEKGWFTISLFEQQSLLLHFWFYPISVIFVMISVLLVVICLMIHNYKTDLKLFLVLLLILELLLIIIFMTSNSILFYICFECSLLPMFIIIGVWGSKERKIRAGFLFLLYSVIGSFLFLTSLIYILIKYNVTDLIDIQLLNFSFYEQLLLWLGCFFSFAVKTPLVPFHLWLPEAHVEAPTAGSVMLAGILLKMGSYGFLRFNYSLFPMASVVFSPYLFLLGILGVLYACSSAFLQFDIKKIIAYSSVAHMSVITLGLFTMNYVGFVAALLSMIAHSFVASGLFLSIGVLYEKFQTRNIFYYGGIFRIMPVFSFFFFILSFSNMAFPGTLSFLGEFFILQGLVKVSLFSSIFILISFIISSVYVLFLLNRILFTNLKTVNIVNCVNLKDTVPSFLDIKTSSIFSVNYTSVFFSLFFLTLLTVFFGIYSSDLLYYIQVDFLELINYKFITI